MLEKNIFRTFPWRSTRSERPHWKCRLQATCCSNWLIVTSSHQNSSEIQMQIQMWPHRRWLGYMTRHQQGKVMFTVLFSSKCIWDAPLRNVRFRERLRDLLVLLLGRCSREVARFCGATRLRESLLKIVTILLLKYSTISSLQSATLIIVVFFSKQRGCVSLAPNIGSEFCS